MRTTRIAALAATAVIAAASLAIAAEPAHASELGTATGFGSTLQLAQDNAEHLLYKLYYGCSDPVFTGHGQLADGTRWADVQATCQGERLTG